MLLSVYSEGVGRRCFLRTAYLCGAKDVEGNVTCGWVRNHNKVHGPRVMLQMESAAQRSGTCRKAARLCSSGPSSRCR